MKIFEFHTVTKKPWNGQPVNGKRNGFTLVEILIVIIIIGILAGLLIPAIGSAMRRSKEFVIQKQVMDLGGALEHFKAEYGVYPPDFSVDPVLAGNDYGIYRTLVTQFVDRLGDHSYGNAGDPGSVLSPEAVLVNPYFGAIPGSPALRSPSTMTAAESLVFWLNDLSLNKEFPLGYVYDSANNRFAIDPNKQDRKFFEFDESMLTDLDLDGWPEFCPTAGPKIPVCYFDSRTYNQLQRTYLVDTDGNGVDQTELTQRLLNFIKVDETDHGEADGGWCYPYLDFVESNRQSAYVFEDPEKYQLISAGMDGSYGKGSGDFPGLRYSKNDDNALISTHRDNITSFSEGRMDNNFGG